MGEGTKDRDAVKFPCSVENLVEIGVHEFIKLSSYLNDHL